MFKYELVKEWKQDSSKPIDREKWNKETAIRKKKKGTKLSRVKKGAMCFLNFFSAAVYILYKTIKLNVISSNTLIFREKDTMNPCVIFPSFNNGPILPFLFHLIPPLFLKICQIVLKQTQASYCFICQYSRIEQQ